MRSKTVKFDGPKTTARLLPWRAGASRTPTTKSDGAIGAAFIDTAKMNEHTLTLDLMDARTLQVPTAGLGDLGSLPFSDLRQFRISRNGLALEWPHLRYRVTLRQLMSLR